MEIDELEYLIKNIRFDEFYIEATFQFKLLMKLAKNIDEDKLLPERNIEKYGLNNKGKLLKKEIDIVIEKDKDKKIAIELKMPMNGQHPAQMYEFIKDIRFLEQLHNTGQFSDCYLIVVTNDKGFWSGRELDVIYSYFRNGKILEGRIDKPTGNNKHPSFKLSGKYHVEWKDLNNDFKYFILKAQIEKK